MARHVICATAGLPSQSHSFFVFLVCLTGWLLLVELVLAGIRGSELSTASRLMVDDYVVPVALAADLGSLPRAKGMLYRMGRLEKAPHTSRRSTIFLSVLPGKPATEMASMRAPSTIEPTCLAAACQLLQVNSIP